MSAIHALSEVGACTWTSDCQSPGHTKFLFFWISNYAGPLKCHPTNHWSHSYLTYWTGLLGPMKGVYPTPDTSPFFPSDTEIQTYINVGRHRHSGLLVRHSTLHSARHSHCQADAGHYRKFRVDTRHSDPPSWALLLWTLCWWFKSFNFCNRKY